MPEHSIQTLIAIEQVVRDIQKSLVHLRATLLDNRNYDGLTLAIKTLEGELYDLGYRINQEAKKMAEEGQQL